LAPLFPVLLSNQYHDIELVLKCFLTSRTSGVRRKPVSYSKNLGEAFIWQALFFRFPSFSPSCCPACQKKYYLSVSHHRRSCKGKVKKCCFRDSGSSYSCSFARQDPKSGEHQLPMANQMSITDVSSRLHPWLAQESKEN
jgi:hypothetical protein